MESQGFPEDGPQASNTTVSPKDFAQRKSEKMMYQTSRKSSEHTAMFIVREDIVQIDHSKVESD